MEVVGGAFFSAFFQQVFMTMDSQEVKCFIRGKKQTDGLLKKLRIKLMSANAVFDDAEAKQMSNPDVKQWLQELKEAVLDAEDLMDEIKTEVVTRKLEADDQSGKSRMQKLKTKVPKLKIKVHKLISDAFQGFDEPINSKIEEIIERLEFLVEQKDAFNLKEVGSRRHKISQRLPSTSMVKDSDVYGRDEDKGELVKLLLSDDETGNKIGVIPIVGMAGIGKTTLAQLVYNDVAVKQNFQLHAWVCVSEEFDVFKITQTIYRSLSTSQNCDFTDLDKLQLELKEALMGQKFLFVLDDVWNEDYNMWDILRRPFDFGAPGSKIVVTARNAGVASTMATLPTHHLIQILEEDCWLLFAKHAFGNASVTVDPKLEVIGRQIVRKCKGLPLAAKSIGGLLRSESNVEEWEDVLKSDIWELSNTKTSILPALWLSYQYLSPHLKRCFAYCSMFPKDYEFTKSELVLLWMAEDLLQPNKKKTMEEVGEKYFHELISRSFFQSSLSKNCFIMHDLISDLSKFVSGDLCIRLEDDGSLDNVSRARHFSYMECSYEVDSVRFDRIYEAKYLRTFLLGSFHSLPKVRIDLLVGLKCLRVLKLGRSYIVELPDSISKLKHLRYIDLCGTQIQSLPDTICSLHNLQTLLLSECGYLAEFPTGLRTLIHLRHLDFSGTKIQKMPHQIGRLTDLQTLCGKFVLDSHNGRNIAELKGFQQLHGTLHISGLENIVHVENALEAKILDKKHLSELILTWEGDTDDSKKDREVLDNLKPHTNLKELKMEGYRGITFPGWLGDHDLLSNLATLQLEHCRYCLSMPALGQLPSLRKLEIGQLQGLKLVGSDFYGEVKPAFRSLELLKFSDMQEWQEWSFAGDFPNLLELSVVNCPRLTGKVPLDYFPRLERLNLNVVNIESLGCSQECIELLSLYELKILKCPNLVCFVVGDGGKLLAPMLTNIEISGCKNLWLLPEKIYTLLPSLKSVSIINCTELESFPEECELPALVYLSISGCSLFLGFPHGRLHAPSLKEIRIHLCDRFRSLPEEIHTLFPSLESIFIESCTQLESFLEESNTFSQLQYLNKLLIHGCSNFVGFPNGGWLHAPNLTVMEFNLCQKLRSLPAEMATGLPSLKSLYMFDCPELESFPEGGLPSKLESLEICGCKKLIANRMQLGLQRLTSLSKLVIDFEDGEETVESFPEEGLLPTTLTSLEIYNLSNFKILDGKELRHLVLLQQLKICGCPQLQGLPDEGLPTSLSHLVIWGCPLLNQLCQKETGEDWPKIAHIPNISIY